MENFDAILKEMIQKFGEYPIKGDYVRTVESFANQINISDAQLSRVRANKSPLSENVINKIYECFVRFDVEYADTLKERLEKIKSESSIIKQSETKSGFTENSILDSFESLFSKLSQPNSLLIMDYRDFPVTLDYLPKLGLIVTEAIEKGLCFAMFNSFGTRESLIKKHTQYLEKSLDADPLLFDKIDEIVNSYSYLVRLAGKVNKLFRNVKNELSEKAKGQLVLYEAVHIFHKKETKKDATENTISPFPSIVASGISSKLLYAKYADGDLFQTKVYAWISTQNDSFQLIELSNSTLNFNAVKLQFNPIPAYWEEFHRLPEKDEIEDAYTKFGFKTLFGEEESIEWQVYKPTTT